jgi:hypothetical protein
VVEYLAAFLLTYLLATLVSRFWGRKGSHLNLFVGTAFARLPIVLFTLLWTLDRSLEWGLVLLGGGTLFRVVLLLSLGWSLCLLTLAVSRAKRLSLARAASVALIVTYVDIAYYLVTQGI